MQMGEYQAAIRVLGQLIDIFKSGKNIQSLQDTSTNQTERENLPSSST